MNTAATLPTHAGTHISSSHPWPIIHRTDCSRLDMCMLVEKSSNFNAAESLASRGPSPKIPDGHEQLIRSRWEYLPMYSLRRISLGHSE